MATQRLKGLWIPAEILLNKELTDKEKLILAMILYLSEETSSYFASNNNYSDSQKQPYPIGDNGKDIINNIKNKNNYNKEDTHKNKNIPYRRNRKRTYRFERI